MTISTMDTFKKKYGIHYSNYYAIKKNITKDLKKINKLSF